MFVRYTQGSRVHIRKNLVQAFVSAKDGARIFLS